MFTLTGKNGKIRQIEMDQIMVVHLDGSTTTDELKNLSKWITKLEVTSNEMGSIALEDK